MIWSGWKIKAKYNVLLNQFLVNFHSKTSSYREINCVFRDVKWCFIASWRLKALHILTLYPPNYSIGIFTHLKLCLADAIHNFKWVKIIQIWQNEGQLFSNRADWCHIMALTCLRGGTECGNNWVKIPIYSAPAVKGLSSIAVLPITGAIHHIHNRFQPFFIFLLAH